MTHSEIPLDVRRKALRGPARGGRTEDPQLLRMLATHTHCGEPMQLVGGDLTLPHEGFEVRNDGGLRTYRCTCGFTFDQR